MRQRVLFGEDDPVISLFERIDSLPLEVQKTYIDVVHFIYWGVRNATFDKKAEAVVQRRYALDATRGSELFIWKLEHLNYLSDKDMITITQKEIKKEDGTILIKNFIRIKCENDGDLKTLYSILKKYSRTHLDSFRHHITENPLGLINSLTEGIEVGSTISSKRSSKILRAHDATSTDSWAFCVPKCFNEALDIRLDENKFNTVPFAIWTQGANFAFRNNDVIYDKPIGTMAWRDFLKVFKYHITINNASPALSPEKEPGPAKRETRKGQNNSEKRKIIKTYPGHVTFSVSSPNSEKTGLEFRGTKTLTQADFVRFLINGL